MTNSDIRYSLGYQLPGEHDSIAEIVLDYLPHIDEVYFAWPGHASGRSPVGMLEGLSREEAAEIMSRELNEISGRGVRLTLLYNANCYGHEAASLALEKKLINQIKEIGGIISISAVTTASPFVAESLKSAFPSLEVRASVNMRVGTITAMEYLTSFFDGFYMQREYNRVPGHIQHLSAWCGKNSKKIYMLVNSGCLAHCPFQTYHDNLVAHESDIDPAQYKPKYPSYCRELMNKKNHYGDFLRATWIRPEDIKHYNSLFDGYKLATRMHANPRRIIAAYARQSFRGNLADLTEPGFSFNNKILDNTLFPEDWYMKTSNCGQNCQDCSYCDDVLEKALIKIY